MLNSDSVERATRGIIVRAWNPRDNPLAFPLHFSLLEPWFPVETLSLLSATCWR